MWGILNCAVPRISDALALENGMGTTIGSPVIVIPQSLDDSIWCLGGCAIGLRMVEKASSVNELLLAVKVLFEVIRLSWRNSEDMERCHGYEILAFLLKAKKREFINGELMQAVAEFIGVDSADPKLYFHITLLILGRVQSRILWHFDICVLILLFGNVVMQKLKFCICKCCCL